MAVDLTLDKNLLSQPILRVFEIDEEKMKKAGERGREKRKGDAPQGSRVTNEKRVILS